MIGQAAFDKAAAAIVQGAHAFGPRVVGNSAPGRVGKAVPTLTPTASPKIQNEEQPLDALSITDLGTALAENPSHFDALYEAELSREDGARVAALTLFLKAESGLHGQHRPDILADIRSLLQQKLGPLTSQSAPSAPATPPATDVEITAGKLHQMRNDSLLAYLGDDAPKTGTGKEGAVTRADLLRAAKIKLTGSTED